MGGSKPRQQAPAPMPATPAPIPAQYGPTRAEVSQSGAYNAMQNNKKGRTSTILTSARGLGGTATGDIKKTLLGN